MKRAWIALAALALIAGGCGQQRSEMAAADGAAPATEAAMAPAPARDASAGSGAACTRPKANGGPALTAIATGTGCVETGSNGPIASRDLPSMVIAICPA